MLFKPTPPPLDWPKSMELSLGRSNGPRDYLGEVFHIKAEEVCSPAMVRANKHSLDARSQPQVSMAVRLAGNKMETFQSESFPRLQLS